MLRVLLLSAVFVVGSESRGINVGVCGDWNMDCQCGSPGYVIHIPVKQCTFFYRWKPSCKPCDGVTQEAVCSKFSVCAECNQDGCTRCPTNKYGQMCTSACQCQNGAVCQQDGNCICTAEYSGRFCEIKNVPKCPSPDVPSFGILTGANHDQGQTVTYSCQPGFTLVGVGSRQCTAELRWSGDAPKCEKTCPPLAIPDNVIGDVTFQFTKFKCIDQDYQLVGSELLNCRSDGSWDGTPPTCSKRCLVLRNPDNGQVIYSAQQLVRGTAARFNCNSDFKTSGQEEIVCNENGNWSAPSPVCERISYCPDPGTPANAQRTLTKGVGGEFSQDTEIQFTCTRGAILVGTNAIKCLSNGTWSDEVPLCTIVSDQVITCSTNGVEVVRDINMPVRITCPSGCQRGNPQVWGTVIYKKESKLCASAIHAGMITKTGGTVDVINNGIYVQYAGSNANAIKSKRHRGSSESFRFEYFDNEADSHCPRGWIEKEKHCVLFVDKSKAWEAAVATCRNLRAEIVVTRPDKRADTDTIFKEIVPKSGWSRVWAGDETIWVYLKETGNISMADPTNSSVFNDTQLQETNSTDNNTATSRPDTLKAGASNQSSNECGAIDNNRRLLRENCEHPQHFVCRMKTREIQIDFACDEPGSIENGAVNAEGRINGVNVRGTTLTFSCQALHYLVGSKTIQCLNTSEWDNKKPVCVKATACKEPPKITNGAYKVQPASETRTSVSRSATLPSGLAARGRSAALPEAKSPAEAPKVVYPATFHPPGTRVLFNCESRYYNLIGSGTRTCTTNGEWSGRQPACQPICGVSSAPRSPFIVNGLPSKVGQWPWQVGIAREVELAESEPTDPRYGWFLICGGSLISESWVVTAAHCVTVDRTTSILPPSSLKLYFGKYHRNDSLDDELVMTRQVDEIHVHHDFNPVQYDSDIALVRLSEPVQLTSRIRPVCLPDDYSGMSERHLQPGTMGVITGWGEDDSRYYSETLLQADIPVVSNKECEDGYKSSNISMSVTGNMFCAGFRKGNRSSDSCTGDSGGPFVVPDGEGVLERWFLEGIVSWGSPLGCGEDRQYGGYTRIASFLDWIQQFI